MCCSSSSTAMCSSILVTLALTLISCLPSVHPSSRLRDEPVSFTTRLIHRTSPESPLYDPTLTPAQLSRLAVRSAKARIKARKEARDSDSFSSRVIPQGVFNGQYLMKYKIGSDPAVETFGAPDTASEIIWLQCLPCQECYTQTIPYFDPTNSTSYRQVMCSDETCKSNTKFDCASGGQVCQYKAEYDYGESSTGNVATEKITLEDGATGRELPLTDMVFGCGHNNKSPFNESSQMPAPGVVGLSRKPLSLVGQLGFNGFSYCFSGNLDPAAGQSLLTIGPGATITGPETQTPLYSHPTAGYYFVKVTGIQVGDTKLDIPPAVFEMNEAGTTGTILDTGTTMFELVPSAFDILVGAIKEGMEKAGMNPVQDPDFDLCYTDVEFAPKITVLFEGLNFELITKNTWDQIAPAKFCLTILRGDDNMSVFGMYMQRDVNVGYNLGKNFVSLAYTTCPVIK